MNRLALILLALIALPFRAPAADAKPNIVFILADDMGAWGCRFVGLGRAGLV